MKTREEKNGDRKGYVEVAFHGIPEGYQEILIAELTGLDYAGFREERSTLFAYIITDSFDKAAIREILSGYPEMSQVTCRSTRLPGINWNARWERAYPPILIAGKCYVRAPFHAPYAVPDSDRPAIIDIIIEPKMSFGTAHHETTAMMIEWLLAENPAGKRILDMGCGTGVLAILASKLGAADVVAIDNDPWAFENARENVRKNNTAEIHVIQGDVSAIPAGEFDLILANISRNVLLDQMPAYADVLAEKGQLFLSGFYEEDVDQIRGKAETLGWHVKETNLKHHWMAVKFIR